MIKNPDKTYEKVDQDEAYSDNERQYKMIVAVGITVYDPFRRYLQYV